MAAIRWVMDFVSQNGTTCKVNIYDNNWTAGYTTQITGAADPFFFEEDKSQDLLNDVIRFRTGYIRVVEQGSYGALDAIYPSAAFDRYVEVLYGSTLIFNGYIQVQDFSSELVPVPRILEFPVISPLGLFDKRTFLNTLYLPPTSVTLGQLLDVMLSGSHYSYVYTPKNYGYPNTVSLGMKVSSLVAAPYNKDYHHSMNVSPMTKVLKGKEYSYLIEAICKAFGWMCHDTPTALVFTAFEYEDVYCYFPVGHIGESGYRYDSDIPSSAASLTDSFTPADSDAIEQVIQPDTGIEISYEGESGTRTFSFDRTYVPDTNPVVIMPSFVPYQDQYPAHIEKFSICTLIPVPNVWETNLDGAFTFDNNDKLNIGTHCVAWNGYTGAMISIGSYASGTDLFWVRFYLRKRSTDKYSFSYDLMGRRDGALGGLAQDDSMDYYITTSFDSSHDDYIQITFKYRYGASDSQYPQLPSQALLFIHNIQLEVLPDSKPYADYRYKPASNSDTLPDTGNPAISSNIEMPISLYRLTDHLVGSTVLSTRITTYPYLFKPRNEITSKFRISSVLSFPHVRLFSYLSKKWRVISTAFYPWDDEVKLTLQNSEIL